jgi:hypothetical protein
MYAYYKKVDGLEFESAFSASYLYLLFAFSPLLMLEEEHFYVVLKNEFLAYDNEINRKTLENSAIIQLYLMEGLQLPYDIVQTIVMHMLM